MNEQKAKEILRDFIMADGGLHSMGQYMAWTPGDRHITLDDKFTAKELEAIAWWMRNKNQ